MAARRILAGVLAGALAASLIHPRLRPTLTFGLGRTPAPEAGLPTTPEEAGEWVVRALQEPDSLSADDIRMVAELARAGADAEPGNGFWWSTLSWGLERLGQESAAERAQREPEAVGSWRCPGGAGASGPESAWRADRCRRAMIAFGGHAGPATAAGRLAGLPAALLASGLALAAGGGLAAASSRSRQLCRAAGPAAASLPALLAVGAAWEGRLAPALLLAFGALAWGLRLQPEPARGVPRGAIAGGLALASAASAAIWAWNAMGLAPPEAGGSASAAAWASASILLSPLPGALLALPREPDRGRRLLRLMTACWAWGAAACLAGSLAALAASAALGPHSFPEPSTMSKEAAQ